MFGRAHQWPAEDVLGLDEDAFESIAHGVPHMSREGAEFYDEIDELESATSTLREEWFNLPSDARAHFLIYMFKEDRATGAEGSEKL